MMREVILHLSFLIQHFFQVAGVCALGAIALFAFGWWLHRLGVFRIARPLFCSVKGAAVGLVLLVVVVWAETKPNSGSGPLLRSGGGATNAVYAITQGQVDAGFALAEVRTNETHDFSMPIGANLHEPWRLRGANRDCFRINSTTNAPWAFPLGTNIFDGLLVSSSGVLVPKFLDERFIPRARLAATGTTGILPVGDGSTGTTGILPVATNATFFSPFLANLGAVPLVNWPAPGEEGARSLFWWTLTPTNSLVLTWREFLLNRDSSTPVSFQAEFLWNGDFIYRYDLASINTNLTSLLYRRVVSEDLDGGDRDGDGLSSADEIFVYGTDPGLPDTDGDGIPDGAEIVAGTNPFAREVSDADILARVGASATNESFLAESVVATNVLAAWTLLDGFAADWPAGATNVLWERSFALDRTSAWQQYFVSASPSNAAPWHLEGLSLEWELSGDDCSLHGSLGASPAGDSWRVPLGATDFPTNLTLRLRATGASAVRCPTPLHFSAYVPDFRVEGGQEITRQSGTRCFVFVNGSRSDIRLVVDHSRRPHRAPLGTDESYVAFLESIEMVSGGLAFTGDLSGGTLTSPGPGFYELPVIPLGITGTTGILPVDVPGTQVVVLSPWIQWACERHGGGYDGLGYSDEDGYYEESYYPLDSACLRKAWHRGWDGGWTHVNCELRVSAGVEEGDGGIVTSEVDEDDVGRVYVDGVEVWSGTAEHVYDDISSDEYREDFLSDECDSCVADCADGNCDSLEGASLGSLRFRIPLGQPVKGHVAGFAWFMSDGPMAVTKSVFRVLAHPDSSIADTTASGTRRIACTDARGRDLRIEDIPDGVRITIYKTAGQTLEHTWEITNVNGDPAQVRLKKISRLDNVMSDETFSYSDGEWARFDNIAQVSTHLSTYGGFSAWGTDSATETRTTYDAAGGFLGSVTTEKRRVGECDNAVLRETYRYEDDGSNWRWSMADYWDDPQHAGRHGLPRLVQGNSRAWTYTDYDENGHETLRVEQRGTTPVPADFPYVVSNVLYGASTLADAFVTVRDYEPLDGDSCHPDDAAKWRTEMRYVVKNGVLTLTSRTLNRYTRLTHNGHPAIKRETWRGGSPSSATAAYSYEITYATTGEGTPFLMRGAVAESLSEDGTLTVNAYSLSNGILSQLSQSSQSSHPLPTYETIETDAAYGTTLRRTTRLTSTDTIIDDEQSIYDDQNRLRSTTYFDGTSLTNAYSCCRLLWTRDRQNRTTLRSAQTGTDHLYNAIEETWVSSIANGKWRMENGEWLWGEDESGTNGFKVTQHFYDALGRETNTVVGIATTPGASASPTTILHSPFSIFHSSYPYGGSSYSIHTDERGAQTVTSTAHYYFDYTEQVTSARTNGTQILTTTTRTYHGGGSSTRREWLVGRDDPIAPPTPAWTEERRFDEYDSSGRRISYVVTTSSDHYDPAFGYVAVTNSISTYDLLGRLVTTAVPGANGSTLVTSNAYDGATSRILTTTTTGSLPVNYFYDEFGERIGTSQGNKTVWNKTTYETISQEVYRVVTSVRMTGSATNSVQIQKTQLTGLSDSCRRHVVTLTGNAAIDSLTTYDPSTGIETTITRTDDQTPVVTRSVHGIPIEQADLDEKRKMFYDAFGRNYGTVIEDVATGMTNRIETVGFDVSGNEVSRTLDYGADGVAVATAEFDMLNRAVRRTDALGHETVTEYDALGRPVFMGGDDYPIRTAYDTQGRKTGSSTTRDNGATWDETQWTFDPASGLNTEKTYADGSHILYAYTDSGQRTRTTWARGAWKENAYNERNLVSGTTYSRTSTPSVAYAYADSDKVASATLSDGTSYAYAYDDALLCTNETATIGQDDFAVVRTYDAFQRNGETSVMVTNVRHVAKVRLYDAENRVCGYALTNSLGRGVNVSLHYDGSYLTNMVYALPNGNQFVVALTRNASRKELVTHRDYSFGVQSVYWYATDYDIIGRPTNATDSVSLMREWQYNNRSELAAATIGTNLYGYSYDTIGNRLWSAANLATNTYVANTLNQYTSVGRGVLDPPQTSALIYDADGNMTGDGTYIYSYDAENRLKSITSAVETNGAIRVLNFYDHRNRRIRKIVQQLHSTSVPPPAPPSGTDEWLTLETHTFVWDGNNIILEKVEFADGTTRTFEYFWGLDKSGTEQGAGGVGGLLAVSLDGVFYIPCYDHNGNIVRYVSEVGTTVAQYIYDPYGNIIESSGPLADKFSFGFSTKYHDREIDMIGYQQRVYLPVLGRWLNRDPIEEADGENLYVFAGNSPLMNWDLLGFTWKIKREGGVFATAMADQDGDTFQTLADKIRLDHSDYKIWAHTEDVRPVKCKKYKIPNLIIYDMGARKYIDYVPLNIISVWRSHNATAASKYEKEGYKVLKNENVTTTYIHASLGTDGLYRYYFTGHGDGHTAINTYPSEEDSASPAKRFTKYGINMLVLQACGSAAIDEFGTNRRAGIVKRNDWECNVAKNGHFIGYDGWVNVWNELFEWTIVRGANHGK